MAETKPDVQFGGLVDVSQLDMYAGNARTHSPEQIEQLKQSIRQFGFVGAIGYDGQGLAIGHGRRQAALEMWAADEDVYGPGKREPLPRAMLPGIDITGLSTDERRALIIADNQLALNAGWDEDRLRAEIEALTELGFEIPVLGFDEAELQRIFNPGSPGFTDPDAVPEEPEKAASVRGDLWVLGNHRLKCGDATDASDVESVLVGRIPHLMVTDPPYGVEYDANWRNEADRANGKPYGASAVGKVENDSRIDWSEAWALFPGDVAYCWHADRHASIVQASLEACGFEIRCQIIWAKNNIIIGRGDYHWRHEPCWYAVRKGKKDNRRSGKSTSR